MALVGGVRCPVCLGWQIDGTVSPYGAWIYTCRGCGRVFGADENKA